MVHAQKEKHGVALDAANVQRKPKPSVGSKMKRALDQIAREVKWYEVECSCCGKPFELPFKPEKKDRPLYGPCCVEKQENLF
ncbi:MAG TPA: hypothetical protein PKJ97_02550 [Candidatus Bilamarchaeaceae archaeon]|nr:hypothetical protein [Candidatus Bilamarchaeaceae archaeon]